MALTVQDVPARAAETGTPPLLEVKDLVTYFHTDFGVVKAVDGVSFTVGEGETFGIVGESGSGKSVTALSIMRLIPEPPGRIENGSVMFQGRDLVRASEDELCEIRGNRIAMIFQDALTALNPVFTVGYQIAEVVRIHTDASRKQARDRAIELLEQVGIPRAKDRFEDYPHQFSGGMRQRGMIAMSLAMSPALLIADEPTTALDVTIQAQILELLKSLQAQYRMGLIIITHDLGVVAAYADSVAVMYAGKIVEHGDVDAIYYHPRHPYGLGLMNSITRLDETRKGRLQPIVGQPPSLLNRPEGCAFHPRCAYRQEICLTEVPPLRSVEDGHLSACHFAETLANGKG
ncbi:MAG: ABC transporter ATP-binding protein, partial [Actinomycetota bacterium]